MLTLRGDDDDASQERRGRALWRYQPRSTAPACRFVTRVRVHAGFANKRGVAISESIAGLKEARILQRFSCQPRHNTRDVAPWLRRSLAARGMQNDFPESFCDTNLMDSCRLWARRYLHWWMAPFIDQAMTASRGRCSANCHPTKSRCARALSAGLIMNVIAIALRRYA